jgi:hypothetical protein
MCYDRAEHPEDKAIVLRLRSRNHWIRNELGASLNDIVLALHALGVEINLSAELEEANAMFEQVKNELLAVGFDAILASPRNTDSRINLAVDLLRLVLFGFFTHRGLFSSTLAMQVCLQWLSAW